MEAEKKPGKLWQALWHPSRRHWFFLWMPIGGVILFFIGIIFLGGFNAVLKYTSTEAFCISCHEMRDNVYAEYRKSSHYSNGSGVSATCADCHEPRSWFSEVKRKIQATFKEVPNKLMGTISTRTKFLAHREELAKDVWKRMRATDSQTCRNCHALAHMDLKEQSRSAANKHEAVLSGRLKKTCIDCHQGIAHELPPGY